MLLQVTEVVMSVKAVHSVNFFFLVINAKMTLSLTIRNCLLTPEDPLRTNFCPEEQPELPVMSFSVIYSQSLPFTTMPRPCILPFSAAFLCPLPRPAGFGLRPFFFLPSDLFLFASGSPSVSLAALS